MPNHCCNILRVRGSAQELKRFEEFAKGFGPWWDGKQPKPNEAVALDLNQFVPVPVYIIRARKNNMSNAFNSGGYEWVCDNWGTKWGCYDISVSRDEPDCLRYDFMTAWAPFSTGVLEAMAERFPTLEFELKYGESGVGFAGILRAADGGIELNDFRDDGSGLAKKDKDIAYCLGNSG